MSIQNTEYRNQNSRRRYPFEDNATLRGTAGVQLPDNFIVDAMLYPIDLENGLYMKSVDYAQRTITFADTVTDKVHGLAVWESSDTVYVYEPETPNRMVGILVLGPGRTNQSAGGVVEFEPAAARLAPAAFFPLNQPGVRGIVLEDGTYYTGAVQFEGRHGVSVHTYVDDNGRSVLEFDISGVTFDDPACFDCELVRCIKIVTTEGSMLVPAPCGSNAVCITTMFDLKSVCAPSNIKLPSKRKDECAEEPPACSDLTGAAADEFFICPAGGRLIISTPSPAGYDNPLWIENLEDPAPPPNYRDVVGPPGLSLDERQRILARMFDASKLTRGKVKLEYRGLMTGRR